MLSAAAAAVDAMISDLLTVEPGGFAISDNDAKDRVSRAGEFSGETICLQRLFSEPS